MAREDRGWLRATGVYRAKLDASYVFTWLLLWLRLLLLRDAADVLGPVLELTELGGNPIRPMAEMAMATLRSDAVPVALGELMVRASVRMRFQLR